jgi:aryl carrier-like protein
MARYGSFKYSAEKYGAVAVDRRLSWGLEVDWDNDGIFDGSNEAGYAIGMTLKRGRLFFMKSGGEGFQPVDVGEITFTLQDIDGRFDPYNIDSPLYQSILPGRRIRVTVKDETSGIVYPVFYGRLKELRQNYGNVQTVTMTAQDEQKLLTEKRIRTNIYTSIRFDTAISHCLTQAGWDMTTDIDSTVSDTMPYWWARGDAAFTEIMSLVDAVFGRFFVSADGTATYLSRLQNDTSAATLNDSDVMLDYGIRLPSPLDVVKNIIRIYARARTAHTNIEFWRLADTPTIPAGESRTIWAEFRYNNADVAATSVTTPVATTDYTANTASDGSGSNLTGSISIVMTSFATSAKLVITNNSVSAAYITLLKVRGNGVSADEYTFAEESNDASIAIYGEREFIVKSDWLQDLNSAIDQAQIYSTQLAELKKFPRVKLRNNPSKQFGLDLFNLVSLSLTNVTEDQRISYIEHQWINRSGDVLDTYFYFEPNMAGNTSGTWIFPATFGLSTVF